MMKNSAPFVAVLCTLCSSLSSISTAHAQPLPAPQQSGAPSVTPQQSESDRRRMMAVRMSEGESIVMDGRLDDEVWTRAVPANGFVQQDPRNGAPPSEQTEVRIVYNRTSLYLGVICHDDEPERLLGFQRRRDEGLGSDDRFIWVIDPFLTQQNGYYFETNPSGLMGDALLGPAGQNRQWDGIWDLRVRRSEVGWTLEIEIPFSTLDFDPGGTSWGINFQRTVRRKNEESLWTGWARNQGVQRLSNTGLLEGLNSNVSQGLGLDIRPYGVATSEASPGTGKPETTNTGSAGLDLVYSLTPGLRSNLTINTDFAQTEVDQRQVNLTQYSLFFPEKRTFFLEGANLFNFAAVPQIGGGGGGFNKRDDNSMVPFFTRRIGLDADGNPQKINYGVKLFGQLGRQDVGVLHVRTGEDDGVLGEDFTVLRLKRRVFRQSFVGGMYTRRAGQAAGVEALQTAGLDFSLNTNRFRGSKNLFLGGFYLWNTNPLNTGKSAAYSLRVDYPNDRWNAGVAYRGVEANFNPAMGFRTRNNYQLYNPYFNFSPRPSNNMGIRRMGFTVDAALQTDMANQWLSRVWTVTLVNIDLDSQDGIDFLVIPDYERLDRNFSIGISPGARVTLPKGTEYSFVRYRLTAQTANRRVIAVSPTVEFGDFYSGTRTQMVMNLTVRARTGVIVYLSHEWNRVSLPERSFVTRLFRVTPELQFNQWISIVNNIQYDSVSAVVGWQSRFRWIVRPGNDLYVVYTQNWLDDPVLDRFATTGRRIASKIIYTLRM